MDAYALLLFVHVLMAVVWVGGNVVIQVLATRAAGSNDPHRMATFSQEIEWVGTRVFTPAALVVLLAGIGLVVEGGWGFSTPWVAAGIGAYVISFVLGAFYLGPKTGKLKKLRDERGVDDPEVLDITRRLFAVSRVDLVILILIVAAMTLKPGS